MINKNTLQSVISKYHLNGLFSSVKWTFKDNTLTIYAGENGRACKVFLKDINFEDCIIPVFDTPKLSKLLSITNGDLIISTEKDNKLLTKMYIADMNFDLSYNLADPFIIPKATYFEPLENPEVDVTLENENIDALIKAKTALPDESDLIIRTISDMDSNLACEFTFGDATSTNKQFTNKVKYVLQGKITDPNIAIPFNSDILKNIFSNNKDMDKGRLKISSEGMLQLNFYSKDIETEYFVIRNE